MIITAECRTEIGVPGVDILQLFNIIRFRRGLPFHCQFTGSYLLLGTRIARHQLPVLPELFDGLRVPSQFLRALCQPVLCLRPGKCRPDSPFIPELCIFRVVDQTVAL